MIILWFLMAVLLGCGGYQIVCGATDVPTGKTSKMMMLAGKRKGEKAEKLWDVYITKIALKLEPLLPKLDKTRAIKLQNAIDAADLKITPEVYLLKAGIKGAAVALLGLFFLPVSAFVSVVLVILGGLIAVMNYFNALDYAKKRKKLIESEIPRFAASLAQGLQTSRDVLRLLTSYRKVAGKEFGQELDITVAEMKTGNYENALIHFESRIGSSLLSDITRGLIGTLRGDDQAMYFRMICFDMRQLEQANLKREAGKRPKQIQKYSMFMLFCILIIYAVVLGTEIVTSLGVFFG